MATVNSTTKISEIRVAHLSREGATRDEILMVGMLRALITMIMGMLKPLLPHISKEFFWVEGGCHCNPVAGAHGIRPQDKKRGVVLVELEPRQPGWGNPKGPELVLTQEGKFYLLRDCHAGKGHYSGSWEGSGQEWEKIPFGQVLQGLHRVIKEAREKRELMVTKLKQREDSLGQAAKLAGDAEAEPWALQELLQKLAAQS